MRSIIIKSCRAQRQGGHVLVLYAVLSKLLLIKFQFFGGKNRLAKIRSPFIITRSIFLLLWRSSLPF